MIEFCIGYLFGITTMCLFQASKEASNEEEKKSDKSKKHTNDKG